MQVLTDSDLAMLRKEFERFKVEVGEDLYELIVARYDAFLHFNDATDGDDSGLRSMFAAFSSGYMVSIYDSKHNAVGTLQ